jgi:hypothetical protein
MAFGQQAGPPATARQVQELLSLLHDAGHADFRDARGPMGFTQRQAAGKFTRDEAEAFIDRLQKAGAAEAESPKGGPAGEPVPKLSAAAKDLARVPDSELAAELQRRGWIVVEP